MYSVFQQNEQLLLFDIKDQTLCLF